MKPTIGKLFACASIGLLGALVAEFILSQFLATGFTVTKMNPATGLTARKWEVCAVKGELVLTHYDSTFGAAVPGSDAVRWFAAPAIPFFYLEVYHFNIQAMPPFSFAVMHGEWHNGETGIVLPQWILLLLASAAPLALAGRFFARRWVERLARRRTLSRADRRRRRVVIVTAAVIAWVSAAGICSWATFAPPRSDDSSAPTSTENQVRDTRHQMDVFCADLLMFANENGERFPGPTLANAIAAIKGGWTGVSPAEAQLYIPMLIADRDAWGNRFSYSVSTDRRKATVVSFGPNGEGRRENEKAIELTVDMDDR